MRRNRSNARNFRRYANRVNRRNLPMLTRGGIRL